MIQTPNLPRRQAYAKRQTPNAKHHTLFTSPLNLHIPTTPLPQPIIFFPIFTQTKKRNDLRTPVLLTY